MASVKGTKTEKNLLAAFAGESQARNRYTLYAKVAKKEGYEHISALFLETAENERVHANKFYKHLEGGEVEIVASYPAGDYGDTATNLKNAAAGENLEWTKLYKESAEVAREEGFEKIAKQFEEIAKVEVEHEKRYLKLLENVKNGKVFKKDTTVKWKCRKCGLIHEGAEPPKVCPACAHAKSYFEVLCENY
ncbi:rubrerythrin [Bdellovibrionota bacterium]